MDKKTYTHFTEKALLALDAYNEYMRVHAIYCKAPTDVWAEQRSLANTSFFDSLRDAGIYWAYIDERNANKGSIDAAAFIRRQIERIALMHAAADAGETKTAKRI